MGCEACVDGACVDNQDKCTGCEDCVNGVCEDNQDKCPGCQDCVSAVCVDNQDKCMGCQDCVNAVCVDDRAKCAFACEDCVNGICEPMDSKCNDGVSCTNPDVCNPTSPLANSDGCVLTPVQSKCDDGDRCTDDRCDPVLGCVFVDNGLCGACCLKDGSETCVDDLFREECPNADVKFFPGEDCIDINCDDIVIPAVSQWGIAVISLLLLIGAKIYFSRRREAVSEKA